MLTNISKITRYMNLFFILSTSISGCLYGYNIGVMSGVLLFIRKDIPLSHFAASLFVSSFLWGIVLVMLIMGFVAEYIGRKKTLLLAILMAVISIFVMAYAKNINQLIIGRLLIGVACGMITLTVPLYLSETLPNNLRGRGTVAFQLFLTFGILLSTLISWHYVASLDWRIMFLLELILVAVIFLIVLPLPESPRWLVAKGKNEQALEVLKKIKANDFAESTLSEMIANKQSHDHLSQIKAIFHKDFIFPLFLSVALGSFSQLTGINVFLQYDSTILFLSGFTEHHAAIFGSVLITAINFLMTIPAIFIADHFERKKLLQFGIIGIILCLLGISASYFLIINESLRATITTTLLLGFIIFFSIGPGALVWTLMSEILPSKIRSVGFSIALLCGSVTGATFSAIFLPLQEKIGLSGIFIFCAIATCLYFYISCLVPNMSNRSLEEIEKGMLFKTYEN